MPLNREVIEQLRKDRGLNQLEAGEAAGFGTGESARIRWHQVIDPTNDPQLSNVEAIASVLKCTVQKILRPTQKRRTPSGSPGSKR